MEKVIVEQTVKLQSLSEEAQEQWIHLMPPEEGKKCIQRPLSTLAVCSFEWRVRYQTFACRM